MKNLLLKNTVYFIYAILLVVFVFGNADILEVERHFFNSDTLYLPSIYRDVFQNGNLFSDFNFNPAPNFFPDMGLHFLLMKLFNQDFRLVALLFSVVQLFVVFVTLDRIAHYLKFTIQQRNFGIGLLFLFFVPAVFSNDFLFTFYFIINSYHLSSFILGLWLFIMILNLNSKVYTILLPLVIALGIISDKLLLVNFIAPFLGVLLISLVFKKFKTIPNVWKGLVLTILGVIMGLGILELNTKYEWISIAQTDLKFSWDGLLNSIDFFFYQTINYLTSFSWVSLVVLLAIVAFLLYLVKVLKSFKVEFDMKSIFLFLMINTILFTPLIMGKITGLDSMRYNYHGLILLIFMLPYLLKDFSVHIEKVKVVLLIIPIILLFKFNSSGVFNVLNLYPKDTIWLEKAQEQYNLKYGVATYWKAKKNTMFSHKGLKIYNVHDDLKVYRHVSNNTWYFNDVDNKGEQPVFNYFISDNDKMTANILEVFPDAQQIYLNEQLFIIKTSDFVFNSDYEIVRL